MTDSYSYKIDKKEEFGVKIEVTIEQKRFIQTKEAVLEKLGAKVKIPGFRAGKAPKNDIEKKLGIDLLNETLNKLLPEIAVEIISKEDLNPITQLEYEFQEISSDGKIQFNFTFTNYPAVKLGDFSKIKISKPKSKVTKTEIDEVIERLFGEENDQKDEKTKSSKDKKPTKVTSDKIKALGIKDVTTEAQLRDQIKSRIRTMKQADENREYEDQVLKEAISLSTIPIPKALLEQQAQALIEDYLAKIEKLDVEKEAFLVAQGLDEKKLEKQKHDQAKQKISAELLLNEIAKMHTVLPTEEDIKTELDSISDPNVRENFDSPQGRRHILAVLTQQRGMQKLLQMVGTHPT